MHYGVMELFFSPSVSFLSYYSRDIYTGIVQDSAAGINF